MITSEDTIKRTENNQDGILFIGDSLTYGAFLDNPEEERWSRLIADYFHVKEYNTAVSGATVVKCQDKPLIQIPEEDLCKCSKVMMLLCTNDYQFSTPLKNFEGGVLQYAKTLTGSGVINSSVYVILPMNYRYNHKDSANANSAGASLNDYKNTVIEICRKFGFQNIDLEKILNVNTHTNILKRRVYTIDGLHYSKRMHRIIAQALIRYIER